MKTLYVSDLDGTLLNKEITTSAFTNDVINRLTSDGILFSYATARSFNTSKKVAEGIQAKIPVIVYNGTFIKDNVSGEVLVGNYFDDSIYAVIDDLLAHEVYPVTYSYRNNEEKMAYVEKYNTRGLDAYIQSREGDDRLMPVDTLEELSLGKLFYITCIDEMDKLMPLYEKYKDIYHCVCYEDIYSKETWFEIMPKNASKANAVLQLKDMYHCDKVVVFGDAMNDYDMFNMADEAYAVSNAVEELKEIATDVIGYNYEDAVAKWLLENAKKG